MRNFLFDSGKKRDTEEDDTILLVQTLMKAESREKMENLLLGLMTPKEIEEFAERIRIVQLLKKGMGQHTIAAKLGVGVATVSRGAGEIKQGRFIII